METLLALMLLMVGAILMIGAIANSDLMTAKPRKLLGRTGTRIVYILVGLLIAAGSIFLLLHP